MGTERTVAERINAAALALAERQGWRGLGMAEIANEAGVSLLAAYETYPDKGALVSGLIEEIDRDVLDEGPAAADESPRDRLFDVMMRRFDALQGRRAGIVALLRALPGDPATALALLPGLARAARWTLEAAGLPAHGIAGTLRAQAVAFIHLSVLRTWLDDDTEDMARTMAALDRALREAEGLARRLPGFAADPAPPVAEAAPASIAEPAAGTPGPGNPGTAPA
jgi:AcrR family transcriptional regulator